MTIGSFVCTSCSGILRGLNPPHRVKSISMASFTPEEMDFLKSHGNELNRKVYLGLYDNRSWPEPDSRDEQRVRDFMVQKYENKRFYVAPTEALLEEAKRMNESALSKAPQTKPLRTLLGSDATKLVVGNSQQTVEVPFGDQLNTNSSTGSTVEQSVTSFGDLSPADPTPPSFVEEPPANTAQSFAAFSNQPVTGVVDLFGSFTETTPARSQPFAEFEEPSAASEKQVVSPVELSAGYQLGDQLFGGFAGEPFAKSGEPSSLRAAGISEQAGTQLLTDFGASPVIDQVSKENPFSASADQPKAEAASMNGQDFFDFGTHAAAQNNAVPVASTVAPRPTHPVPVSAAAKPASTFDDLLGIIDSPKPNQAAHVDPFAPAMGSSAAGAGGFADFSNFGSASAPSQPVAQTAFPPMSAPLQPFSGGGVGLQPLSATPTSAHAPQTSTTSISSISDKYNSLNQDKYAAFAELDFSTPPAVETTKVSWGGMDSTVGSSGNPGINWGGTAPSDGKINWGGPSSTASSSSTVGGAINWNTGGGGSSMGVTSPAGGGSMFGQPAPMPTANPFGASTTSAGPVQANPFSASMQPTGFSHTPVSAAPGFGHTPASTAAGFGYGQYPVQNGGYGVTSTVGGGYGAFGGPPTTAPPSYGVAQQQSFAQAGMGMGPQGFPAMQPQGYPTQPGFGGGGWGVMGSAMPPAASAANPFMNAVSQQHVAPRGGSTNPFL